MRWMTALMVLASPGLSSANGPGPSESRWHCESNSPRWDRRDITCPLGASEVPQRFRFTARFSGSHDDTTATIRPTLDGSPLPCEPGSKTESEGEDGDVSLECRFAIPATAGAPQVLRFLISWHHAEYTDYKFGSE